MEEFFLSDEVVRSQENSIDHKTKASYRTKDNPFVAGIEYGKKKDNREENGQKNKDIFLDPLFPGHYFPSKEERNAGYS